MYLRPDRVYGCSSVVPSGSTIIALIGKNVVCGRFTKNQSRTSNPPRVWNFCLRASLRISSFIVFRFWLGRGEESNLANVANRPRHSVECVALARRYSIMTLSRHIERVRGSRTPVHCHLSWLSPQFPTTPSRLSGVTLTFNLILHLWNILDVSDRRGSNPQPSAWEADALPLRHYRVERVDLDTRA